MDTGVIGAVISSPTVNQTDSYIIRRLYIYTESDQVVAPTGQVVLLQRI